VRECHETGVPIIRALWLHHPDDATAVARGDEYLWGRDLLVAPVVEKGATSRRVYLPRGAWIDFWTEKPEAGGREVDRPVDLATMPLYVRAGTVLPMAPVTQYTDQPTSEPMTLVVYPGADATSFWYDDDGKSFAHRQGAWMRVAMRWQNAARQLTLSLAPGGRMLTARPTRARRPRGRIDVHAPRGVRRQAGHGEALTYGLSQPPDFSDLNAASITFMFATVSSSG
jgi:alpha-glucosidase/alpha-D-xyloside xylohydrolase